MLDDSFLWGGAVTAHQSEGGYTENGKSPAVCDWIVNCDQSDFVHGIDTYHHYEEDFALLEEMGFRCYRFSIDWSRVMPDGQHFSESALQFYDRFIDSLLNHGMEPMVTLYHFEMPQVLATQYNGFYSRKVVDIFIQFVEKVVTRYHDRVKKWIVFNEQNAIAFPKKRKIQYGATCPEGINEQLFINQLVHNTFVAGALANRIIHRDPTAIVLGMVIYIPIYAKTCRPEDEMAAWNQNAITNMFLEMFTYGEYSSYMLTKMKKNKTLPMMEDGDLNLLKNNPCDWLSLSYYFSKVISSSESGMNRNGPAGTLSNPYLQSTKWGWEIDPLSLRIGLKDIYAKYRKPIMIVENGLGMEDIFENHTVIDDERIEYMRQHIHQMLLAIQEGVDCRGYLVWGPIDILSSQGDMTKRYGLIYVNRDNHDLKDMKRYKKKSFGWFQKVIQSNGKEL